MPIDNLCAGMYSGEVIRILYLNTHNNTRNSYNKQNKSRAS